MKRIPTLVFIAGILVACTDGSGGSPSGGNGGSSAKGGAPASGGASGGATSATGGASMMGGTGSGGSSTIGGASMMGGTGSGGSSTIGGKTGSGGTPSGTGGVTSGGAGGAAGEAGGAVGGVDGSGRGGTGGVTTGNGGTGVGGASHTNSDAGVVDADVRDANDAAPPINSVHGIVLANDSTIFYSPGNWAHQGASSMESVNAGAYFRTIFSGTACTLNFDVSADGAPLSEVYVSVDSATPVKSNIASTLDCTPTSTNAEHSIELTVKSTSQALNRWNPPPKTGILFTSMTLGIGAYTRMPSVLPCQGIIFGDSITEGINTTPGSGGENDQADATLGWAYLQKRLLNCEIGVVGFGYQGFSHVGNGDVPVFGDAWPYLFSTLPRNFSDIGFVIVNQGTNDGTNDETSLEQTFLTNILSVTASTDPIVILRPFNGAQSANWKKAIATVGSPRVHFVDTTGFFDTSESVDGLHPNATADAKIAPLISAQVSAILK